MSTPDDYTRPLRLADLPPRISDALTRPARPGEIEALRAQIENRGRVTEHEPAPTEPESAPKHLQHPILTPAEREQELRDAGRYQSLDEQIDDWLDEYGGTVPPDVLADMVRRHKAHLASRMLTS